MMPVADARTADLRLLPALLILGCVTFNAVLAAVNAQVTPLTPAIVIVAEIALVGAAHLVAIANWKPQMTPWYVLIGVLTVIALLRSLLLGEIEVKFLRDVIIIPTFVVLGMCFDDRRLDRLVVVIHAIVLAFLALEALDTDAFAGFFKIQDYYINTRGFEAENFWNKESELFVSATRPDGRSFGFIDLHRLSSIFLEPVSLGNYCIVIAAYVCARFERLAAASRIFLIGGVLLMMVGSDGRLAMLSTVALVAASVVASRLPAYSAVLYLPAVALGATALVDVAGFEAGGDDFPGRIAHTVELLRKYGVADWLGLSNEYLSVAVDSGLAYLITTQSVIGVALLWLFNVYSTAEDTPEQVRFTHAICLYLALTMMVSFSFVSIKTAALLWFVQGVLQGRSRPVPSPGPQRRASMRLRPTLPLSVLR